MSDRDARYDLDDPAIPSDQDARRTRRRGLPARGRPPQAPRAQHPRLPGRAGGAGPDRRRCLRRRHEGCGVHPRPVLDRARLPGSGPRQGHLRGRVRRHRRADRPQPQGQGRGASRSTPSSRPPTASPGIQVGLLPAEEGDAGGRRVRHPEQPGQHHQEHGDHPRGLPGPADRRPARQGDRLPGQGVREGAAGPGQARAARLRERQPGGLPVPVDVRLRAQRQASRHAEEDGGPLAAGRRRRRPRGRRGRARATRPAR